MGVGSGKKGTFLCGMHLFDIQRHKKIYSFPTTEGLKSGNGKI